MDEKISLIKGAEAVSMFCRLNINLKRDLPVRSSEMGLLILIATSEEPITSKMAADFFKVSKPMIATMVNALIKKEYISKKASKEDKRSFTLVAKKKAIDLVEDMVEIYLAGMKKLKDGLGEHQFMTLIELLNAANTELLKGRE